MACLHHPRSYIFIDDFCLRFLRYHLMDAKAAVKHMLSFLNGAHELFGTAILERPLQMSDLSKDGMDLMRTGEYQCLPFRDRSGRRIQVFVGDLGLQFSMETSMKVVYYLLLDVGCDGGRGDAAQRCGGCGLVAHQGWNHADQATAHTKTRAQS